LEQYLIPPINVTGYGSLSYGLLGVGLHPFPNMMSVGENGFYGILHISGNRIAAAEEVPQQDVIYNPQGVTISNSSLSLGFFGRSNLTILVTNQSGQTMDDPEVIVSVPGDSGNYTDANGVKWMYTMEAPSTPVVSGLCLVDGRAQNVTSGGSCTATLDPIINAPPGSAFRYSVEARGFLGAHYFVTKQTFSYSSKYMDQAWVAEFISLVNSARNGSALVESHTLDAFAAQRFSTAVTQPDISDYGLATDTAAFFGTNATASSIAELLLYPGTDAPYAYESVLQGSAPGHWGALTDVDHSHYGYYIGAGPYEFLDLPCPVTEIPRAGINITQFFGALGCSVGLEQATWLVIILGN
jgi:hypothetical protein